MGGITTEVAKERWVLTGRTTEDTGVRAAMREGYYRREVKEPQRTVEEAQRGTGRVLPQVSE